MNQNTSNKMKFRIPIIILSSAASILSLFHVVLSVPYNTYMFSSIIPEISDSTPFMLDTAVCILFLIYVLFFNKSYKLSFLLPIVLGGYLFEAFHVANYLNLRATEDFIYFIISIAVFLLAVFLFMILKGKAWKIAAFVIIGIGLSMYVFNVVDVINYYARFVAIYPNNILDFGRFLFNILSFPLLSAALLMFLSGNKVPCIQKGKTSKKVDTKKELLALKDKLELGIITEEEYNTLRSDIISKL